MSEQGVEMIAPRRRHRRQMKTQDGRPLRRARRRWLIERFFAWIGWNRRVLIRWEDYTENFLGWIQLACMRLLLRARPIVR